MTAPIPIQTTKAQSNFIGDYPNKRAAPFKDCFPRHRRGTGVLAHVFILEPTRLEPVRTIPPRNVPLRRSPKGVQHSGGNSRARQKNLALARRFPQDYRK
jgi:hypothetical protein